MVKNVELRLKYTELVQQGKESEAQEVLKQIWALKKNLPEVEKTVETKPVIVETKKEIEREIKDFSFDELVKIKGIGKETVKDIKIVYPTKEKLIEALKSGEDLPFRNDVETKLRKYFNI